ncbi:hypothetical protein EVAR_88947_1 [Eumeta japonica]|uniref:PiggyBac transposable element-derived protein domain-containing protein n=1 Tax=Eumeta variegata TaxID=151549 RepID=A0A4C1VP33_EUMVA|nr:hypothetical protein EVAR_88947_1 [Eumeta japonica]
MENWFTSIPLAKHLAKKDLTVVGTTRKNKCEIPESFLELTNREKNTAMFAYEKERIQTPTLRRNTKESVSAILKKLIPVDPSESERHSQGRCSFCPRNRDSKSKTRSTKVNNSDWEFFKEDDDTEYLPPDAAADEPSMTGNLKYPQGRLYWSNDLCTIDTEHYDKRSFLRAQEPFTFVDNFARQDNIDELWKIRPIITKVQKECHTLTRSKNLSIDDQMIPYSGWCEYCQYVPSKPNPLGFKNFMLAARDGVLNYEIHVGSNTVPPQDIADLGLRAGVVKLLCRTVDKICV